MWIIQVNIKFDSSQVRARVASILSPSQVAQIRDSKSKSSRCDSNEQDRPKHYSSNHPTVLHFTILILLYCYCFDPNMAAQFAAHFRHGE